MDEDLGTLVGRARGGDRDAFGRIYERLSRPVLLHLTVLLGRVDDAEDALQAAFLRAWTGLPRLREPARFTPWLFRVARNTALDMARRRKREPMPSGGSWDGLAVAGEPAEGDVRRAVEALRPATRSLVLLRAVQGWSAEEVAEAFGLHAATVRRRYARALEHLRTRLEGSEVHGTRA